MNPNNRGIVLCFLIYIALCATIVSIIEMPWITVPIGSKFHLNMSEISMDNASFVTSANLTVDANLTFTAKIAGYCGVSGYCYPFEDDSVMISLLTGKWGSRCRQIDPREISSKTIFTEDFVMARHLPFYVCWWGSVFLFLTWIVGICSCCNQDCGFCTIYSVFAVMLTFGGTVFGVGGMTLFLFSNDDASCIRKLCGYVTSAFDIGNCNYGWSLFVAAGGVGFAYFLAILSCILAAKTPLRNKSLNNPIVEVRSADYPGRQGGKMITSRA